MAGNNKQTRDEGQIVTRRLLSEPVGEGFCHQVLRVADTQASFYFSHHFGPAEMGPAAKITPIRGGGGMVATVAIPEGEGQKALFQTTEGSLCLAPEEPELDLLARLDCVLSVASYESSEEILNWLIYHCEHHEVTGGLLFLRLGPGGEGSNLAAELAEAGLPAQLKRLVLVEIPVPAGRRDLPDARDRLLAPDAPGRALLPKSEADPWRSPFGDEALLELAREQFLGEASGCVYLDPSDYLAPRTGTETIFEMARNARDFTIALQGVRTYPWSLVEEDAPQPGDHTCRIFDKAATFSRWCTAPGRVQDKEQIWRPHRILGLAVEVGVPDAIYRFMAMKHPECKPAQLAPKSSLVSDQALIDLAGEYFGYEPSLQPQKSFKGLSGKALKNPRITLVTAMKNEGPFLLEWIAYNRVIGVSDILVYSNDCTDGTDEFLDLLDRKGIVHHRQNPYQETKLKPQHAAFRAAEDEKCVKKADWLMTIDVDEYMAIHVGEGRLKDLFEAVPDANMISMTWRLFGNGDIVDFKDEFVTKQFTECASEGANRPHQAWGFKTMYQNVGLFRKLGVHRPKGLEPALVEHVNWVNGSGQRMPERDYRTTWRSTNGTIGYELVTLNHYAVRSSESFLVKRDRGRVNHVARDQGTAYWFRMNHNTTEDHAIERMLPALQEEWDRLVSDEEIRAAHDYSVQKHRQRIRELREQPDYAEFFDQLNSARLRKLSRILPHFGQNVFLAGPETIPDEIVEKDLPADFYFTVEAPKDARH